MAGTETIKYSLKNLSQRRGRSFLTVFSILVGIATIFIFISFGYGLYKYVEDYKTGSSADKILIMAKGGVMGLNSNFKLTEDDLDVVEKTAGISKAMGVYFDVSNVKKGAQSKYVYVASYDPKNNLLFDIANVKIEVGRDLQANDRKKVILGNNYLIPGKIFYKALEVNDNIEVNGENLKVVGFLSSVGNPSDDSQVYVTNDYFLELYPNETSFTEIIGVVEDTSKIDFIVSNVERNLRKSRDLEKGKEDFFVQSFEDLIESFSGALDIVIGFVLLIALISVIVSAINTANTMITSVLERYKEIGILKAIGAKNSEVFTIFLFESAFLGFVAGIIGTFLGYGVASLAGSILKNLGWGFLAPYFSPIMFIGCVLFATITGAISGVIPAWRASKTNTVDALRYE